MDLMALSIPIRADASQAVAAFKTTEQAGTQAAAKISITVGQASAALKTLGIDAKLASVNGIERIVVNARQLDQTNQILTKMGTGFKAVAVEATRAAVATEKVAVATTRVGRIGPASYQRWGNAAVRASGALMLMDSALEGNDKSAQQLLKTGSSIAFMFGPAGAVVGAIGIAASMIVGAMDRSREAIEKVKKATEDLIAAGQEMTSAPGFASLGAARGQSFKMGIRLAELTDQLEALEKAEAQFQKSSKIAIAAGITTPLTRSFDVRQIESIRTQIGNLKEAYTAVVRLTGVLSTYEATQNRANVAAKEMAFATPDSIATRTGTPGLALGGVGAPAFGGAAQAVAGNVAALASQANQAVLDARASMEAAIEEHIAVGIGNALQQGFARAFSGEGITGLIQGFAGGILGALGQMFAQMGQYLVKFGVTMVAVREGLKNPFTSGAAAIAAGVALMALGAAMGALGSKAGGGGGSAGGGGASRGAVSTPALMDSTQRYSFNPQSMDITKIDKDQPIHFTIIGTKDIQAQNDIADMVSAAKRRGRG